MAEGLRKQYEGRSQQERVKTNGGKLRHSVKRDFLVQNSFVLRHGVCGQMGNPGLPAELTAQNSVRIAFGATEVFVGCGLRGLAYLEDVFAWRYLRREVRVAIPSARQCPLDDLAAGPGSCEAAQDCFAWLCR
jgi:hypothetical protein